MNAENSFQSHNLIIKIREKCLEAGIETAAELQSAANLELQLAEDLFEGKFSEISLETLGKLLEALGCEASDLFERAPDNLKSVREILGSARRVFVLTGAGISAESGVPTFRSGGDAATGVWRGMPFEKLSSAQMADENLPLVWEWFDDRRAALGQCPPNAAHESLAEAQQSGRFEDFTVVTQNVDGLHQAAGAADVIELHGSIWRARCLSCQNRKSLHEIPDDERPPVCDVCSDSMRPDVVLFGEAMPMQSVFKAQETAKKANVCLVVGTSAQVYPAAGLPAIAKQNGAVVIEINPEETALSEQADFSLRGRAGELLPLIFAGNPSVGSRLPDINAVKTAVDRSKNENRASETKAEGLENPPQNKKTERAGFMTSETHPLRVDFVRSNEFPDLNRLGMTFAPGKNQTGAVSGNWDRNLETDLMRLREYYRVDTLVSLIEDSELEALGISNLEKVCRVRGIELVRYPISDFSIPVDSESYTRLIGKIADRLKEGKVVVVHCKGGLGRAGMTAACAIVAATDERIDGEKATETVRAARPGTVETCEQEKFVSRFSEQWRLYRRQKSGGSDSADKNQLPHHETRPEENDKEITIRAESDEFKFPEGLRDIDSNDSEIGGPEKLSGRHFMLYWQERSVRAHEESAYPLDVVSSRQLKRARVGDTLWVVTIDDHGDLILAGRLKIEEIVDYKTAAGKLDETELWEGAYYALPSEGEAEHLRWIKLEDVELELRFAGSEADRFLLKNGGINPQQLQTMRRLNKESAELLEDIWETEDDWFEDDEDDDINALLADDPKTGEIFDLLKERGERIEYFRREVERDPSSAEAHYNLGVAYDEAGDHQAIAEYEEALRLDPQYYPARFNLGVIFIHNRNFTAAIEAFETIISHEEQFAPAHFVLGAVRMELGDYQGSIAATERGVEHDREDDKAYYNIGMAHFHLREFETAIEFFRKSIELNPENAESFYQIGKCCRALGLREEEFNSYLDAIDILPDHFNARFALGTVWAHLDGGEEGAKVRYFEPGSQLMMDSPKVIFYIGLSNIASGDPDLARGQEEDLREMNKYLAEKLAHFIRIAESDFSGETTPDEKTAQDNTESGVSGIEKTLKTGMKKSAPAQKEISVFFNNQVTNAKSIPELYKKVLKYFVDAHLLNAVELPVATGKKRYLLATEPVHPTGKPFMTPVEYQGFFMEAHNNRQAAIVQLEKLAGSLGCELKEIHNFDSGLDAEPEPVKIDADKLKKFQGCLLGGAVGDAVGAAVEFDSIETIRRKFGEQGLTDYAPAYGRIGAITDDTQMTLFTAEGLLRAESRFSHKGICNPASVIFHAYVRWLHTQNERSADEDKNRLVREYPGWLFPLPELNHRRAPGNSCLSALRSGKMGKPDDPINKSKGCGGVMRVAPVGLFALDAFGLACEAAAITHGHPTGYLSAGVLALIVQRITEGKTLSEAVRYAVYEVLPQFDNHEETLAACDRAIRLAQDESIAPSPETVETLGGGWIAEESLAIALYCSLVYENDFKKAVLLAVNHSGDSDSTGAITGNILGVLHGRDAIPAYWLERLELRGAIEEIAEDLLISFRTGTEWVTKYPEN